MSYSFKHTLVSGITFCSLFSVGTYAQEPLEKQVWSFVQLSVLKTKTQQFADAGFRTYNQFVRDPRQWFVRYHLQRKIGESNLWIGGGVAYFETASEPNEWNPEIRPFGQGIYFWQTERTVLRLRYRNEIRYYMESIQTIDRNRLQLQLQFSTGIRSVKGMTGYEAFYSTGLDKPWEHRLLAGLQLEMKSGLANPGTVPVSAPATCGGNQSASANFGTDLSAEKELIAGITTFDLTPSWF